MIEYHKGDAYDIGKLYKLTASYLKSPVYEILVGIHKSGSHPFKSEGGGYYSKAEPVCKTMLGEVKGAPRVTRFDSMQELVRNVTDEIKQESKMKHKNTEGYYNEKSKDHRFAPSFDNLSASAKNHWEREFDKYIRNNTPIELEDGCVYQFDIDGVTVTSYAKENRLVAFHSGTHYPLCNCTNIVKLVPEVK